MTIDKKIRDEKWQYDTDRRTKYQHCHKIKSTICILQNISSTNQ